MCCKASFDTAIEGEEEEKGEEKKKIVANWFTISIPTFIDVSSYEKINTFHVCVQLPRARSRTNHIIIIASTVRRAGPPDHHYYYYYILLINKTYTSGQPPVAATNTWL